MLHPSLLTKGQEGLPGLQLHPGKGPPGRAPTRREPSTATPSQVRSAPRSLTARATFSLDDPGPCTLTGSWVEEDVPPRIPAIPPLGAEQASGGIATSWVHLRFTVTCPLFGTEVTGTLGHLSGLTCLHVTLAPSLSHRLGVLPAFSQAEEQPYRSHPLHPACTAHNEHCWQMPETRGWGG